MGKSEVKVSELSDIGRLSNTLDSLVETLRAFESSVNNLHSDVFKEVMEEAKSDELPEAPKNKVIELMDKVNVCFDIQRMIATKFEDFKNLLY